MMKSLMTDPVGRIASSSNNSPSNVASDLYNNAILKAHFGKRNFQDVTIILNYADPEGIREASALKTAGIPFIIRGHPDWAKFSDKWVYQTFENCGPESKNSSQLTKKRKCNRVSDVSEENVKEVYEVNTKQMIKDIGNELVPVILPDYDPEDPIKHHITVKEFLEETWIPKLPRYYLHQWQFPLAGEETARRLCLQSNPLPTLGLDLLQYGHDSCVVDNEFDSPFQYLFMGQADTYSKMHRDTGGMTILIAPLIGTKEVTLVHRDDGRLLYQCTAPVSTPDYTTYPLSAFIRAWKTIITRGDILVLPPGTYHAARNIEPCLSYSRMHVDSGDLMQFFNSWMACDAPTVHHKEVIWNSCIELISLIENQTEEFKKPPSQSSNQSTIEMLEKRDALPTLTMLRHIVQTVINMNPDTSSSSSSKPSSSSKANNFDSSKYNSRLLQILEVDTNEWKNLLDDIDGAVRSYLVAELSQSPRSKSRLIKKDTSSISATSYIVPESSELDDWPDSGSFIDPIFTTNLDASVDQSEDSIVKSASRLSKPTNSTHSLSLHTMSDDNSMSDNKAKPLRSKCLTETIAVDVLRDKKGQLIYKGCLVGVGLFKENGYVIDLWKSKQCVLVHYEGFDAMYDEYVDLSELRDVHGHSIDPFKIYANMKVMATWGEFKDEYLAQIIPLHTWNRGRKSTKYKTSSQVKPQGQNNEEDVNIDQDDSWDSLPVADRERIGAVLHRGPIILVRFGEEVSKHAYSRLFPLYQVHRKRNKL